MRPLDRPACRNLWLPALLCAALAACGGHIRRQPTLPAVGLLAPEQARALADRGEFRAAAEAWLSAARAATEPSRMREFRLRSADAFLKAGDPAAVRRALSGAGGEGATPEQLTRIDLRLAEAASLEGYTQRALALLTVPESSIPASEAIRFYTARAGALEANGEVFSAARDWMAVAHRNPEQAREAAHRVLRLLNHLPLGQMQQLSDRYRHLEDVQLWLQFALQTRDAMLRGEAVGAAIARFARLHPNHPASRWLAPELQRSFPDRLTSPDAIAVLLPLTGRFAPSARALRNALIAAWFNQPEPRPDLRMIDTTGHVADINDLYQRAVDNGAQFVIGPLERSAVDQLQANPQRTVPVLALNEIRKSADRQAADRQAIETPQTNAPLFQFSLNPEQGAAETARLARRMGKRRAALLIADNPWGQRLEQAFRTSFTAAGGEISDSYYYQPRRGDFGHIVERLMGLNASKSRYRRIHRLSGGKLSFEATPRDDIDMIFMAARPKSGRALRPLLNFYHATDLPVFASAEIYAGSPEPKLDEDLNGVYFCDAPWVLELASKAAADPVLSAFPNSNKFVRLYALGLDAYRVLSFLPWLQAHPMDSFPGLTGDLRLAADGSVRRSLSCTRIAHGKPGPVLLPDSLADAGGSHR